MGWKNFGKIFVLIQLNPEFKELTAALKLLHKYFSDKNFQIVVICRANQWTGFYIIGISDMKELILFMVSYFFFNMDTKICYVCSVIKAVE